MSRPDAPPVEQIMSENTDSGGMEIKARENRRTTKKPPPTHIRPQQTSYGATDTRIRDPSNGGRIV